jgi:hypothetical protein
MPSARRLGKSRTIAAWSTFACSMETSTGRIRMGAFASASLVYLEVIAAGSAPPTRKTTTPKAPLSAVQSMPAPANAASPADAAVARWAISYRCSS